MFSSRRQRRYAITTAASAALLALAPAAQAVNDVAGNLFTLKQNGGWSWFMDNRAIVDNNQIIFSTVAGVTDSAATAGDVQITSFSLASGATTVHTLDPAFQRDDHDAAAILTLPDGRYLAVWEKHGSDDLMHWARSTAAGSIANWDAASTLDVNPLNQNGNTYANVYRLSSEAGKIYNFSRSVAYDPNYSFSTDNGATFQYGGKLMTFTNPNDGSAGRPYVRYTSNNTDKVFFITTDDHPRNYPNSIYAGYVQGGNVYRSSGTLVGPLSTTSSTSIAPSDFSKIFQGDANNVGWTVDLELDSSGNPYAAFQVRKPAVGNDIRYHYARWTGTQWVEHEMAYGGTYLYQAEGDYSGLVALDPQNPNRVYVSTNADPATGTPLVSAADGLRHWEIFKGLTTDGGATWSWSAVTSNSSVDNIRPIIPSSSLAEPALMWMRGTYTSYTDYDLDIVALIAPPSSWNCWNNPGGGNWDTAGNWTIGSPNAASAAAYFGISPTPPTGNSTITINGTKTVGALTFGHSTYSYSLVSGASGALVFDNGGGAATITVNTGNHSIGVPVNVGAAGVNVSVTDAASLTMSGNLTGSGGVQKISTGLLVLSGNNTYSGATTVAAGRLRITNAAALSANSNLTLNGGVLETNVNITRVPGTGAGQVQMPGGTSGFTANGGNVTVNISPGGSLTWGASTFNPSILVLNDSNATHTLTFPSAINLGSSTRTISTGAATASMSGILSGTAGLIKDGAGTLVLSAANTYTGATTLNAGTLHLSGSLATTSGVTFAAAGSGVLRVATANSTLGSGTINIASSGGAVGPTSRLELAGNANLANAITFAPRNNSSVAIESLTGNNALTGPINIVTGGTQCRIQVDTGQLGVAGNISTTATTDRFIYFQGAGTGTASGVISDNASNPNGKINVIKEGAGTWTLSGANTYTGTTSATGGVLALASTLSKSTSLSATGATIALLASPTGNRTIRTQTLAATLGGQIDLQNNKAIITASNLATVNALVASGRNGGAWTGQGIITNRADADSLTTGIAIAQNSALPVLKSSFGDQSSLAPSDILLMYTYVGDRDLDADIDGDDYAAIDAGFASNGVLAGYINGDFNYSGNIDADDYFLLDRNYSKQHTVNLAPGAPAGVTSIPEPTAAIAIAFAASLASSRRRKR